ncbi:MAG: elongation factor G [Pseudomonadota bacterium]
MNKFETKDIRNVVLIGGKGVGKTSLIDALLFVSKGNTRLGKVDDGTSMVDYDPIEQERRQSITSKVLPVVWESTKINIIDTPGYSDFLGEVYSSLNICDVVVIVVDAVNGVEVNARRLFNVAKQMNKPCMFFITKMDNERADPDKAVKSIKDELESAAALFQIPIGKGASFTGVVDLLDGKAYKVNGEKVSIEEVSSDLAEEAKMSKSELMESIAESSEELLNKYLEKGDLSEEDLKFGMVKGIAQGELSPIFVGSAHNNASLTAFLATISKHFPAPSDLPPIKVLDGEGKEKDLIVDPNGSVAAHVFKITSDPGIGDIFFFKLYSGRLTSGDDVYNSNSSSSERIGHILSVKGKDREEINSISAGDIAAVAKLKETSINDSFSTKNERLKFKPIEFPTPVVPLAVIPKTKKDQDKLGIGLQKLIAIDPTFHMHIDREFAETIVTGMGEVQIDVMIKRLKERYGVEVDLGKPHIPFREMITKRVEVQGKHKKQSGGHGQFGDCWLRLEPTHDGKEFEFVDSVVGGSIPGRYIPAVEKGVKESMKKGTLAGYPVVNLRVTVYDGSYHAVDSSDLAFQVAASMAFKKGMELASPQLLEPVVDLEVYAPQDYMGDLSSDISQRRGRVSGMESGVIKAKVPMSELYQYSASLKSITSGAGTYTMTFSHYEPVPPNVAQRIITESKKEQESDR